MKEHCDRLAMSDMGTGGRKSSGYARHSPSQSESKSVEATITGISVC